MVKAQENEAIEPDSLDLDELEFEPDLYEYYKSSGWFPLPFPLYHNLSFIADFGDTYDIAENVYHPAFVKTKYSYSGRIPIETKDRYPKKYNSEEDESGFPESTYWSLGFDARFAPYSIFLLRANISVNFNSGIIFSEDNSKFFLDWDDQLKQLKEVSAIHLDETSLNFGAAIHIPVYGAYFKSDEIMLESTYYLMLGYRYNYYFYSKATQYMQIVNAKSMLRYPNGRDTIRLVSESEMDIINKHRNYIDIGIGVDAEIIGVGGYFELTYSIQTDEIIKGTPWRRNSLSLRMGLHILELLKLMF
jgi:hypothetical protein